MFRPFLANLRREGVPVSLREYLAFLEALAADLVIYDVEGFYHLARLTMVKDERHVDRFDRAFALSFSGLETLTAAQILEALNLPPDWLEKRGEKFLTEEERAAITATMKRVALLMDEIGWATPLADLTEAQVRALIEEAVEGFREAMSDIARAQTPEVPF